MGEALLAIERMCHGGAGVGRIDGKACFVQLTAPGDQARVRVVKEKRSYLEATLVDLPHPSPLRVVPPCPAFGTCGGCNWQHLRYEEQLEQKREIFAGTLSRIGKVDGDCILPVAPSPSEYAYRSRIQLKAGLSDGKPTLGFYRTGTHEVIKLPSGCAIADPVLNRMTAELQHLLGRIEEVGAIPQIDLSMGDDGAGIAVVHYTGRSVEKMAQRLKEERSQLPSVAGLFLRGGAKSRIVNVYGVEALSYRIPAGLLPGGREMTLSFSRGGFSQVNYRQNVELIRTVLNWGEFTGKERVLDLYCGNGNITVPVAPWVARIHGVEGYAPSIDDAVANAARNGVDNATFEASDAAAAIRGLTRRGDSFDVVILDPPRSGADAAADLARLGARKIIYVSCDPATLARDVALICGAGYRVRRSQPVDMFPQTYHLESVTELIRS